MIQLSLTYNVTLRHVQMTQEEAEERAMVDVVIAAMHEEEYREYGFPLPDNEPNPNAVEVRDTPLQLSSCEMYASLVLL